jgi:hypothetical protein
MIILIEKNYGCKMSGNKKVFRHLYQCTICKEKYIAVLKTKCDCHEQKPELYKKYIEKNNKIDI